MFTPKNLKENIMQKEASREELVVFYILYGVDKWAFISPFVVIIKSQVTL